MKLNKITVWKFTTLVLAVVAVVSFGLPVKVNRSQMKSQSSPLPIVKPVLANELYSKFSCPCCGEALNKEDPCCDSMSQMIDFIDNKTADGLLKEEVMLATAKEFGIDRLIKQEDREKIKEKLIALAPVDAPRLEINELERDLGKVSLAKGKISTDFEIKNIGQSELIIDKLSSSCGCTSGAIVYQGKEGPEFTMPGHGKKNADDWQVAIAPGDTAILRVYYDPSVHPDLVGAVTRTVSIFSNDPIAFENKVTITLEQTK